MEIQAIAKEIFELKSGTTSRGNTWKQQDILIETLDEKYPKKMVLQCRGRSVEDLSHVTIGCKYQFSFDIDANEWRGRWFNTLCCHDISPIQ